MNRYRSASVLLFLMGLMAVMLVVAYVFVSNVQMAQETRRSGVRHELAARAAEMGMQHAIAVCMQGYAMPSEARDAATVPALSRIDSPPRTVFQPMSPRLSNTAERQHPPQAYDIASDLPFNDLYAGSLRGTYHYGSSTSGGDNTIPGFSDGWSMDPGYARWFEANRFTIDRSQTYDPSTYDLYTPASPNPGAVSTPFPVVDPFAPAAAHNRRHGNDNPLWLDADLRPLDSPDGARYRLRYAVNCQDMSAALWLNTDMPWLSSSDTRAARKAYKESVFAVGQQMAALFSNGNKREPGIAMESVFLGFGQYGNSRFVNGVPTEWATDADGIGRGGQPMWYRGPNNAWERAFHCVHGSPLMNWNDPASRWLGSALASWNDLSFSLQDHNRFWQKAGETESLSKSSDSALDRGAIPVRGERVAQFAATPFGRPDAGGTDHPWAVNVLIAPMRIISAMIGAYMPPAVREPGVQYSAVASSNLKSFVLDPGPDLFTRGFAPAAAGTGHLFDYPVPLTDASGNFSSTYTQAWFTSGTFPSGAAARDYWAANAAFRRNHQPNPNFSLADQRPAADRYPGGDFFAKSAEWTGHRMTYWSNVSSEPRQVVTDSINTPNPTTDTLGLDILGRHIVFYDPQVSTSAAKRTAYLSSVGWNVASRTAAGTRWAMEFTPMSPFGWSDTMSTTSNTGNAPAFFAASGGAGFNPYRYSYEVCQQAPLTWPQGGGIIAPNSYWNRLAVALAHAVVVTQVANLSWANPSDPRSRNYNPSYSYATPATGVQYKSGATALIKGRSGVWDPQAAHFSSMEQVDRQFLANLGESFDRPGKVTPAAAAALVESATGKARPPRHSWCKVDTVADADGNYVRDYISAPGPGTFSYGSFLSVREYAVTNNIRTLLTPIDTKTGAILTPLSSDDQTGLNVPPRKLWLLDEWNAASASGYTPGSMVGNTPTPLAYARAKLMERVLNDMRMSFLGSSKSYLATFRPKDFDGDGKVFCSGYLTGTSDAGTGLACWRAADANGDGPATDLTAFSVTGCFAITRSKQFKLRVRGELYDNMLGRAVSEQFLESALLIDPDGDVTRGSMPGGLDDTTVLMQRPIHNYYRGEMSRLTP